MSYVPRPERPAAKAALYAQAADEIAAVLDGETNVTARMATVSAMLHEALPDPLWTGFYVVDGPDELVIGPYQGTLACLRIRFGHGVCGLAAAKQRTVIVDDVHTFPGHIVCDSRAESEIVVPVFGSEGRLIAVFDIDSAHKAAFDSADAAGLEALLARVFSRG